MRKYLLLACLDLSVCLLPFALVHLYPPYLLVEYFRRFGDGGIMGLQRLSFLVELKIMDYASCR